MTHNHMDLNYLFFSHLATYFSFLVYLVLKNGMIFRIKDDLQGSSRGLFYVILPGFVRFDLPRFIWSNWVNQQNTSVSTVDLSLDINPGSSE
jgi:hypothetical protein